MKKRFTFAVSLLGPIIVITGCATTPPQTKKNSTNSPSTSKQTNTSYEYPKLIQNAMKFFTSYTEAPLWAPTEVVEPSSGKVSVESKMFNHEYMVTFYQSGTKKNIDFFLGSPELTMQTASGFETFAGYGVPQKSKGIGKSYYKIEVQNTTLDKSTHGVTYKNILVSSAHGLTPSWAAVTWETGKYQFEVSESSTTSLTKVLATANGVIDHLDVSSLPAPYRFGIVSTQLTPNGEDEWTQVSWDKEESNKVANYKVQTYPLCKDFIFSALKMAGSMRPYS